MNGEDESDKPFDPTPQKLLQARKKGEFPRSTDLLVTVGYVGFFVSIYFLGEAIFEKAGDALSFFLQVNRDLELDQLQVLGTSVITKFSSSVAPVFLLPTSLAILAIIAQRGFVFTPSKLAPKISRVSILQNAKNKYGLNGIFEFAKNSLKMITYGTVFGIFFFNYITEISTSIATDPKVFLSSGMTLLLNFLAIVMLVSVVFAITDVIWQHNYHIRKNRMSRKEIMDEMKESEGDPHMKHERRLRAQAVSAAQIAAEVPKADVIVVNPTHYAVALKWTRAVGSAPICSAKGVDEMALRIREIALEHAVPIYPDPLTARALYKSVDVGEEISPEFYQAVAAAVRFADDMKSKARSQLWAST